MRRSSSLLALVLVLGALLLLPTLAFGAPVTIDNTAFAYYKADGSPADIVDWPAPGTWLRYYDANMSGGGNHFSGTPGAYAEASFTGTNIDFISTKGPNRGDVELYIDGAYQATIDEYDPAILYKQVLWSKSGLSPGTHTLKVVALGTGAPPYNYAEIDAIVVDTVVAVSTPASSVWSLLLIAAMGIALAGLGRGRLAVAR